MKQILVYLTITLACSSALTATPLNWQQIGRYAWKTTKITAATTYIVWSELNSMMLESQSNSQNSQLTHHADRIRQLEQQFADFKARQNQPQKPVKN